MPGVRPVECMACVIGLPWLLVAHRVQSRNRQGRRGEAAAAPAVAIVGHLRTTRAYSNNMNMSNTVRNLTTARNLSLRRMTCRAFGRRRKLSTKCGTLMKKCGLAIAVVIQIVVFILLINALRWTAGYDVGPVTAFTLSIPGGYGDFGVDSWRLLSGVWLSVYRCPPQGGLTTILDFALPKWWYVVICAACSTILVLELFWLALLVGNPVKES
jgi:hypothetical protein